MGAKENALVEGLVGLSSGWLAGKEQAQERQLKKQQLDEELAWKREQRQSMRDQMARENELRVSLANAARPAQVDAGYQVTDAAGSNAFTKDADAAAVMGDMVADQRPSLASATRVQDTAYRDPRQAQAAQAQYNSAPATLDRMGLAAMPNDPAKGLSLQGQASTARKSMNDEQKRIQAEIDDRFNNEIASIAFSGPKWWESAAEMYSKSNIPALKGMKAKAELSGDGRTVNFIASMPDGTEKVINSFEASERGAQDWAQQSARADSKTKLEWLADRAKQLREEDKAKEKSGLTLKEIQARGDEDRKTIDYKRQVGDGKDSVSREERLRYTSLFQDAGRRQSEAQKTLNTLLKERAYANAKPGTPQAEELQSIREAIKQHGEERKTYQSLLAKDAGKPAEKPADRNGLSSTWNTPERESDRMRILQSELVKAKQSGNAGDVAALEREIARAGGAPAGLASVRPASQGQPVKVTTAAEHAALPKGTRYTAPDGSVRIKQ